MPFICFNVCLDSLIADTCVQYPIGKQLSPAVSLSSSALNDGLDEDAQFLQACVSTDTHPDDTDPQAVIIWKHIDDVQ